MMDLTIPASMLPSMHDELEDLLDLAEQNGALSSAYPAAKYLFGLLKGAGPSANASSSRSSTPRRRTKALTKKAHDLARRAVLKASRNDRRKRMLVRGHVLLPEMGEHHSLAAMSADSDADSDSDVPLSHRYGSTAPSSLTPLSTPMPASELEAPLSDDESEPEVRHSDNYAGSDA